MLTDDQIAERLRNTNADFRELQEVHHQLDEQLQELLKNHILTPEEEVQKKQIQRAKLSKKDRMAMLIREYRNEQQKIAAS
ncbi:MAG: DUF465 domain-containing protein [Nitrospira sp. SB0677_bin_15]|nr:DUF465 domain-containing protein [Nitrospira sp. SB0667_bin_9]MYD32135.1 DUF465 domain-containing protein [Nitrospira sp. SB0661_bin_20]MYG39579.1 DUF465 domain-containing protein [Nitrospira sp. SB0677_bin_15]MYH02061.1 DUF465 domain-containing protein [Nitrospira sp. SB0675_bin_23]